MADENAGWIVDIDGNKAQVLNADQWSPRGWKSTSAPKSGDKVWLQQKQTGGKQLFDKDVVEVWAALGWKPSAPPEPVDLTKDNKLTDPAEEVLAEEVAEVKPAKSAASAKKEQ